MMEYATTHPPRWVKISCYPCGTIGGVSCNTTGASWEKLSTEAWQQARAAGFIEVRDLGPLKVMALCPACQEKIRTALPPEAAHPFEGAPLR